MTCAKCGNNATQNAILDGVFGSYCSLCIAGHSRLDNPQGAQHARDRDREDYQRDLIQPWMADGTPNREFVEAYPELRDEYYTEEQLKKTHLT